jgi:hypothetical protein
LAELCSGTGIWFGERSCVDGEQRDCINEESMRWIHLDIQINEKWKTDMKHINRYCLDSVDIQFLAEIPCWAGC